MSSDVSYPPIDTAALMPRAEAETAIAGFDARITALEGNKKLQEVKTGTVGESLLIGLQLGVKRYNVTVTGLTTSDRVVAALNGIPQNGSLQDVYVSAANTVSMGVLVPALTVGATISIPYVIYKVT